MSGHCKGCGVYHEEDDGRLCGRCVAPFATFDDYGCIVIEGMQSIFTADHNDAAVNKINAAVTARERKAAAQALREAADWLIRFPHSVSDEGKFATANAMLDGITVAVTGLRSRADAIEKVTP